MPCYRPIHGYFARRVNGDTHKRSVVFTSDPAVAYADRPVTLPCGKCIGCRLERARQWSVRCMHEAKLYANNVFITLTYNEGEVPRTDSGLQTLNPEDWVLFMKRLREFYGPGIRFFQCGEYGDITERPHHHALLFNHHFPDRVRIGKSKSGEVQYRSDKLEKLWGHGYCTLGTVTRGSASYIARYTMKKVNGQFIDKSPVVDGRVPEYLTMSRKPGIGYGWLVKFHKDVYPSDELVVDGKVTKPPRFYDKKMDKIDRGAMLRVAAERRKNASDRGFKDSQVPTGVPSLYAREVNTQARITTLSRDEV